MKRRLLDTQIDNASANSVAPAENEPPAHPAPWKFQAVANKAEGTGWKFSANRSRKPDGDWTSREPVHRRQHRYLVPMAALLLSAATMFTGCEKQQQPAPPAPKVSIAQPVYDTVINWDEYPAHVEAVDMVEIRPRVSGYIDSIHFVDGAEVKAGELLFVIDPKPYQAELDRAVAERQRSETKLELTRNDLKRAENLRFARAISEEEYDSRSKAVREAEAALAASRAAENTAKINLDYTQIKAPINGRIGRRIVTVGNMVQSQPTGTVLAVLVSMDPIYCTFDVEEAAFLNYRAHAGLVKKNGTQNSGSLICEAALVNEQEFPHKGKVDFFDNTVNEKTGTIRMRGVFANADRSLVPGMFTKVRVPAGPATKVMLVPAVAVSSDQGQPYVLVVNKENVVEPRHITTGRQHGQKRAVIAGLTLDDRIIINGMMMARPGSKVDVVPAASAPSGSQTAQQAH